MTLPFFPPISVPISMRRTTFTAKSWPIQRELQKQLFEEMKGRIKEDDSSVPAPDGPFAYYSKYVTGGQQPLYCRKARDLQGEETVLLDGNKLAEGKEYYHIGSLSRSQDHTLGAWSFDDKGSEYYTMKVRRLDTGEELPDEIVNTGGHATWSEDGSCFFYTLQDENHRPLKIFRHALGTKQSDDVLVYEEKDTSFFAGVGKTNSDRFIVIDTHTHETSETWIIDATRPADAPKLIAARSPQVEYDLEHWNDIFIIRTNIDDAEDYKIVTAPVADPSTEKLDRPRAAQARALDRLHGGAEALACEARTRGRPAAHHRAQHGNR